jgi:single-strand DNA-binding protein
MRSINRVVLICGLTRDPKLTHAPSGKPVATLRVVFTTGRSIGGEWREKPNYIDVEVWASQAENAAEYLSKGRQIAVDGRLEWSQYEGSDGRRRQAHRIVAKNIQYLSPRAPAGTHATGDDVSDAPAVPSGDPDGDEGEPARAASR